MLLACPPASNKLFFTILSKTLSAKRGIANGHLLSCCATFCATLYLSCSRVSLSPASLWMEVCWPGCHAVSPKLRWRVAREYRFACDANPEDLGTGKEKLLINAYANIQYSPESRCTFFCGAFSVRHVRLPDWVAGLHILVLQWWVQVRNYYRRCLFRSSFYTDVYCNAFDFACFAAFTSSINKSRRPYLRIFVGYHMTWYPQRHSSLELPTGPQTATMKSKSLWNDAI